MRLQDPKVDVLASDAEGVPLLGVEVKNIQDLDLSRAQEIRDELLSYARATAAPYWMLVSQDKAFVWSDSARSEGAPPALVFDFRPMVDAYVMPELRGQRLDGRLLEVIVWQWLLELATQPVNLPSPMVPPGLEPLIRRLRGGDVMTQRAA